MDNAIMIGAGVFVIALLIAACFASDAKRKSRTPLHEWVPALGPLVQHPEPQTLTKHHVFRLHARNQWRGTVSYQCRCGARYTYRPVDGWKLGEQPAGLHGRRCSK